MLENGPSGIKSESIFIVESIFNTASCRTTLTEIKPMQQLCKKCRAAALVHVSFSYLMDWQLSVFTVGCRTSICIFWGFVKEGCVYRKHQGHHP